MSDQPLSDPDVVDRVGADLRAAGFDSDGVPELLGAGAHAALGRGEPFPALRATRDGPPLATAVRLFLLGTTEPESAVRATLPSADLAALVAQGVLEPDADGFRAGLDIRPHADEDAEFLVVSDLDSDTRPGPVRREHVLGIGSASVSLARAVIRRPVGRALDLGTGCGIQALHTASHAGSITATDVSRRALALAGATARINGQHWDLRRGSLFEPVAGERFDLIVSNPPFVVGDGRQDYVYRDSGVAGDGLGATLVGAMADHLNPGGTAQLLANWIVRDDGDWRERVGDWVTGSGLDAWVVQRELADPAEYVSLWLKDAGERGGQAEAVATAWLDWFAAERVTGIGMGLITLQRNDSATPLVTLDEITGAGEAVTGPEADAFLARRRWLDRAGDADLLGTAFSVSPGTMLEHRSIPGNAGWQPVLRLLRRPGGPGATLQVDEWGEALLGGCTGTVPLALQLQVLAAAHGLDVAALAGAVLPAVRVGVLRGLLHPVDSLPA
ncbi:class I SAM-dependent methyltransferase [Nakamurella flavida]|uniref:Class I SAM-dependent methyltransferase n=1 Tax=Nakamurella flavida TaxID=363630 RepID=A0A939C190_9ACTN|nr:class I SAM-dependent methyltransferase [Nakamurella flavida]